MQFNCNVSMDELQDYFYNDCEFIREHIKTLLKVMMIFFESRGILLNIGIKERERLQ